MKTLQRICIEDFVREAENGDRLELKRGREYITSPTREQDDTCIVFTNFWERVPARIFAGAKEFTP